MFTYLVGIASGAFFIMGRKSLGSNHEILKSFAIITAIALLQAYLVGILAATGYFCGALQFYALAYCLDDDPIKYRRLMRMILATIAIVSILIFMFCCP